LDDNEIEDLEPSTDLTQDVNANGDTADQQKPATSSSATGEEDDLLNVVRDVVTESRQEKASPATGEENGQTTDNQQQKEQDDEGYTDVPFHKHPRFQQLLRQRNGFKQDAERYNNVQSFLDNQGLSAEEAADGLTIMGLIKNNPVEAWKQLKPTVQKLLVAAGEVLPTDLQQMVQEGKMDQAAALEVSRARAGVAASQTQQSFAQQRDTDRRQRESASAITGAADDWETRRRRNDPNFDAKFEPLQKEILFLQQKEGRPTTPDGVKDQLDRAYKAVSDQFKPAPVQQQRKPAIRPVRGGEVAGRTDPANMSTLDIIRARRSR
jgi:hypothetical protein